LIDKALNPLKGEDKKPAILRNKELFGNIKSTSSQRPVPSPSERGWGEA